MWEEWGCCRVTSRVPLLSSCEHLLPPPHGAVVNFLCPEQCCSFIPFSSSPFTGLLLLLFTAGVAISTSCPSVTMETFPIFPTCFSELCGLASPACSPSFFKILLPSTPRDAIFSKPPQLPPRLHSAALGTLSRAGKFQWIL